MNIPPPPILPPPPRFVPPIPVCEEIITNNEAEMIEFKRTFLLMSADEIYDLVKIKFKHFNVDNEQIKYELNVLVIIYGFLTKYLSDYCKIIIKGGKVIQQWHKTNSTDVDIMLIPPVDIVDKDIVKIAKYISDFVMWVTDFKLSLSLLINQTTVSEKTVYKISKMMGPGYYIALSDIGVGYNHLNGYIQKLYKDKICSLPSGNLTFNTLCAEAFIKEKIFYICKYNHLILTGQVQNKMEYDKIVYFITKTKTQLEVMDICNLKYANALDKMLLNAINGAIDALQIPPNVREQIINFNLSYFYMVCQEAEQNAPRKESSSTKKKSPSPSSSTRKKSPTTKPQPPTTKPQPLQKLSQAARKKLQSKK